MKINAAKACRSCEEVQSVFHETCVAGFVFVKGNIFDPLGFSPAESSALKIKAELLSAILEHVKAKEYTQIQLADILDEEPGPG